MSFNLSARSQHIIIMKVGNNIVHYCTQLPEEACRATRCLLWHDSAMSAPKTFWVLSKWKSSMQGRMRGKGMGAGGVKLTLRDIILWFIFSPVPRVDQALIKQCMQVFGHTLWYIIILFTDKFLKYMWYINYVIVTFKKYNYYAYFSKWKYAPEQKEKK